MKGREYLHPARDLAAGTSEPYWRGAAVPPYYPVLLGCREALIRWGVIIPRQPSVHTFARFRLSSAKNADLKTLGTALEALGRLRTLASYDLRPNPKFGNATEAKQAVQKAENALSLLDA